MLIDTHCHLTYPGLIEQTDAVLARAQAAGIARMITIGTHFEDHSKVLALLKKSPNIFAALGIHPHHAAEVEPNFEAFLENKIKSDKKIVAVGECGLDYNTSHGPHPPKPLQRSLFIDQLQIARKLNLPAILHVREAHADALAIMQEFPDLKYVVHCFTGTPAECQAWIDAGAYIGITGIVTYKNAEDVKADAKLVPADKLLIETDAPYLSPEPVRKIKTNEPSFVKHVADYVAMLRGTTPEEIAKQTTANALSFFGSHLFARHRVS